ncbi:response regulator [Cupriavidus basilensis]
MSVERSVIYLVDDDEIVLWTYHELLRGLGADIRQFVSSREFVESYRPAPVECLVCDLRMPGMCGLQVQGALVGMGVFPPTIFVSAYSRGRFGGQGDQGGRGSISWRSRSMAQCWYKKCGVRWSAAARCTNRGWLRPTNARGLHS